MAPPDIVFDPAGVDGEDMLPPDIEPEFAGVEDGPDIDPPVCATTGPASAVAPSVMSARAAARYVKLFMVVPLGPGGPARLRFRPVLAELNV
jgi:hypothetical protein